MSVSSVELEPIRRLVPPLARSAKPAPILALTLCLVRRAQLGPMLRLNHPCVPRAVLVTRLAGQLVYARLVRKENIL